VQYVGEALVQVANITPEEAQRQAFDKARSNALSQAGVEVVGVTSSSKREDAHQNYDNFMQFTTTQTRGLIVKVDTLQNELKHRSVGGSSVLVCEVKIRAHIKMQTYKPDPGFNLEMNLNQKTFREGEKMVLTLMSKRDCYLTIFNLYSNDSLTVLIPSVVQSNNALSAGKKTQYPPEGAFWELPVGLVEGVTQDEEAIVAVATRKNIPFPELDAVNRQGLLARADAQGAMARWLAEIPASERTQAFATYRIVK